MNFTTACVTGASGFIGRSLVDRLRARGCSVLAVGRTGSALPHDALHLRVDTFSTASLRTAMHGQSFDILFHLAAYGVTPEDRDAETMEAVNIAATGALVEAAAACGARGIVYVGSCAEYAGSNDAISEDAPLTTTNTYGASKAAGGIWGTALATRAGIPFCWVRLFGVYGPSEASYRLIPYVIARLRRGEVVDLTPGAQLRDFMYIDDAVTALIHAADVAVKKIPGPFNLCTGSAVAIRDVAKAVATAIDRPHALLAFGARPYRPDEAMSLVGAPGRFQAASGFLPSFGLEEGIRRMVAAIE
jgi:nucleoside-diphosphate-sugar epimerase